MKRAPLLATILAFALLVTVAGLRYKGFFSVAVFVDLLRDNAFLGIAAVGMTFVILSGGIDLSVGAVVGLTSIVAARLMQSGHLPPLVAITIVLAFGVVFGSLQGWIIAKFDLPPFLVTLAGMFLARGLAFVTSMEAITIEDPLYKSIGSWHLALPTLFIGVLLGATMVLNWRPFGRNVYGIGGSEPSALLMGVPVFRTKIAVYAISGFCAALAGVAYGFYTSSGSASAGTLLELDAIAAVVIGGTLLSGGVGSVLGTLFGVLVLGVIQTAITFEGTLNSWWTKIVTGVLLLLFILIQKLVVQRTNASSAGKPPSSE